MGVAFGELKFVEQRSGYHFIKDYCQKNQIKLVADFPEDKMISTMTIPELKVCDDNGVEIEGIANQITGLDSEEYEISIFGIPYPFYEEEFPHHVKDYKNTFDKE